jgi:hypothetical protein
MKYDRQDQQGRAKLNERTPHDLATRTSGKEPRRYVFSLNIEHVA